MSHPVHLILSAGTRIVTRNDANRIGGQAGAVLSGASALILAGGVGVIIESPTDAKHAYKVRFNDGAEAMLRRTEFSILKEFKEMPAAQSVPPGPLSPQRGEGQGEGWENPASQSADQDFDFWQPFIIYRCVVGSQAY